jgi:hypothetical protein
MKEMPFMNLAPVYIEITQSRLKALRENAGLEIALERSPTGQLTTASKEDLALNLQKLLQRKSWQPRVRAICAISAGGVSLRRMALPAVALEELPKLMRLQIENEFPLSPDELAWGYRSLGQLPANGASARQEYLVGAVKKDRIEEYASVLFAAGLNPVFTPAAMARSYLCPQPLGSCALVDAGEKQLELIWFENGVPGGLRVFPRGTEGDGARLDPLVKAIGNQPAGYTIYVTTENGAAMNFLAELQARARAGIRCQRLETVSGEGRSAAVLGLKKAAEENPGPPLLLFQTAVRGGFKFSQPVPKQWAIRAAALLCALLVLPYAEALLLKGHLTKKLSAIQSQQGTLSAIDHEFDFLRFLKQSEPPYLDALYLFAKAAPPGMRLDSTSMDRRGEVTLRGSLHDAQQVTDFRAKLMDSGFFERVTVEEQIPTPDHQKVNVRITAQWKPVEKRAGLAIGPTHEEIEKAKTNSLAQASGPFHSGLPPGLMPR